ncbi:MAG: hypothetical protein LAN37_04430 [Acidobacteriia bacterium]|nr:hypothetical protein [Terriglobia bacterium]
MKTLSLSQRVIGAILVSQLILTAGLITVAFVLTRSNFLSAFDATLYANAMRLAALAYLSEEPNPRLVVDAKSLPRSGIAGHPDFFEMWDERGSVVAVSPDWHASLDYRAPNPSGVVVFLKDGVPYRGVVLHDVSIPEEEEVGLVEMKVSVFYASSTAEMNRRVAQLGSYLGGASLLLFVGTSVFAAVLVRRGLQPLQDLASRAACISTDNWEFPPDPRASEIAELKPLVQALDDLLSRLHASFVRQQEFTSDAAHELKTCAAIVKSSVQVLMYQDKPAAEYRAGLTRILEDTLRLETLLDKMLRLERIEQLPAIDPERFVHSCELTSTCEGAAIRVQSLAEARNVKVIVTSSDRIHLRGDSEDLELLWTSLLENAIRHSPPGASVRITVSRLEDNRAAVTVEDAGEGIPPEHLPRIFERFYRIDPSRSRQTGGSGLGLAICRAIVTAHRGSISVASTVNVGTRFEVIFCGAVAGSVAVPL